MTDRITLRSFADIPTAALAGLNFLPVESVVVLGLDPFVAARYDITDTYGVFSVAETFTRHGVDKALVCVFSGSDATEVMEDTLIDLSVRGLDVLGVVAVDVAAGTVTSLKGEVAPYAVPAKYQTAKTREDYAAELGLNPDDGMVVGNPPEKS